MMKTPLQGFVRSTREPGEEREIGARKYDRLPRMFASSV